MLIGQIKPLEPKHVWSIRVRLEIARSLRDLSIRQYARLVHRWVESIGLESTFYGTHSMRRTKAAQIYRKTGNLRAVQLLLGHSKLESTVRYLGIEVDDALNIAEQIEL